jgi:hypothetical protein
MNILSLVALSLMFVVGALFLTIFFTLKICVQRFAGFIKRPYWLLFLVSLAFMLLPLLLGGDRDFKSLFDVLVACIFTCGAIGFVVSMFWMATAGFLSLFRQLKCKR